MPPRPARLCPRDRSSPRPAPSKSPSYTPGRDSTIHRDRHARDLPWPPRLRGPVTFLRALPSLVTNTHPQGVDMIMVTGATGNVGRPLVTQLLDRGAKVRAISRHPKTAGLPDGAEVVQADPSQPDSLHTCFDGVTAIFLNARAVQTAASKVLTVAKRAGV